jgi:hypothetical protein
MLDEIAKAPRPGGDRGALEKSIPGGNGTSLKPPRPNYQENLSAPADTGIGGAP